MTPRRDALLATLLLAGLVLATGACGSEPADPQTESSARQPAAKTTAAAPAQDESWARDEAEQIYATRCQTCHGPEGAGDGPGSAGLSPKPRNFQDPEFQQSVSDDHLASIIQYGGAAVGLSPTMPGNPDLTSRPEVVEALVAKVRDLGRG